MAFGRSFPVPVRIARNPGIPLVLQVSLTDTITVSDTLVRRFPRQLTDTGYTPGTSGSDTFTRGASSGAGWGTASGGAVWTQAQGGAAATALTGTTGTLTPPATTTESMIDGVQNYDSVAQVDITWSSDAVGGSQSAGIYLRWTDASNNIRTALNCPAGSTTVAVVLTKVVGGVATQLKAVNVGTITAGTTYTLKVGVSGINVYGKAWQTGNAEPTSWLSSGQLASLDEILQGSTGIRAFAASGNTNAPVFTFDNFQVTPPGDYISIKPNRPLVDSITVTDSLVATKSGAKAASLSDTITISDSLPIKVGRGFISTNWTPTAGAWLLANVNLTASDADWGTREASLGRTFAGKMKYKAVNTTVLSDMSVGDPFASIAYPTIGSFTRATNAIYAINAGTYDSDINTFAATVKGITPVRVWLRLFWEFNLAGATTNGAYNPANYTDAAGVAQPGTWTDFQNAWIRIWTIFFGNSAAYSALGISGTPVLCSHDQVKFAYNPNKKGGTGPADPTLGYPGSQYVDWIMIDTYPNRSTGAGTEALDSLKYLVTTPPILNTIDFYNTFAPYGKPMAIGETSVHPVDDSTAAYTSGVTSPLTRVQWWTDALATMKTLYPLIRMVTVYDANDSTWPTTGHTWKLDATSSTVNDSGAQAFAAYSTFANDAWMNPSTMAADDGAFIYDSFIRRTRAISDTISVSDSLAIKTNRALADTISVTDTLARRIGRPLTDTISVSDALSPRTTRALADTISVTDSLASRPTRSPSDTVSISDSLALRVNRQLSDTITITDTIGRGRALVDTACLLNNTATLTDDFTRGSSSGAGWGTASSGFRWTQSSGNIADTGLSGTAGTLAPPAATTITESMTDGVIHGDVNVQVDTTWSVAPTGTGTPQDRIFLRYIDTNNYIRAQIQEVAGSSTFSLVIVKLVGGTGGQLAIQGQGAFTPGTMYTLKAQIRGIRVSAKVWPTGNAEPDWMISGVMNSLDELLPTAAVSGVGVFNSSTVTNSPVFTYDNYSVTPVPDSIQMSVNRVGAPTDTISISDSLVATKSGGFSRSLSDTIAVSDSLALRVNRQLSDTISVSDSLALKVGRMLVDTISVSDALSPRAGRSLSDTIGVTDSLAHRINRMLADTIAVSDSLVATKSGAKTASLSDTISVSDSLATRRTHKISDTITVTDALTFAHYPRTSGWLYRTNYEGCMVGIAPQANRIPADETLMGRQFWLSHAVAADGPFNPTGKDALGNQVEAAVDWTKWYGYIINGDGTGFAGGVNIGHPIDVVFHIMGIRTGDATWPAGGFTDMDNWVYGDNSYVDQCVTAWSVIMKTVPRYQLTRMWHEMGQPSNPYFIASGSPKDPYINNWQKIVTRLRQLGALGDPLGANQGAMGIGWCPAGGLDNTGTPVRTDYWVGETYTDWIMIDAYNFQAGANTDPSYFSSSFYDYYTQYRNPIMVAETGISNTDTNRIAHTKEWAYLLETKYQRVKAVIYWDGAGNDFDNTPTGFDAAWADAFDDAYFLPNGVIPPAPTDFITIKEKLTPATKLVDSISITDSLQRKVTRQLSDTITFTDAIARGKFLTDTITLSDAIKRLVNRQLSDTITLSDSLAAVKTTAGHVFRTLTDVGAFPGLLTDPALDTDPTLGTGGGEDWLQMAVARKLADTITLSDAIRRGKSLSDTVSVSDAIQLRVTRAISDTLSITDSIGRGKSLTDTVSFSDSLVTRRTHVLSDSITVTDTLSPRDTRPLADTVGITDSLALRVTRNLSDTIAVSDALLRTLILARALSDTISVTDGLVPRDTRPLADTVGVSDSLAMRVARKLTDTISMTDIVGRGKSLADTVTLSDTLALRTTRKLTDSLTVSDSISHSGSTTASMTDTISFTDSISVRPARFLTDSITLTDSMARSTGPRMSDSGAVVSDLIRVLVRRQLSDGFVITDGVAVRVGHFLTDGITISDLINKKIGHALTDTITITEAVSPTIGGAKSLNDFVAVSDSLRLTRFGRTIIDSVLISDMLVRSYVYFNHPARFASDDFPSVNFANTTFPSVRFDPDDFESVDLVSTPR